MLFRNISAERGC